MSAIRERGQSSASAGELPVKTVGRATVPGLLRSIETSRSYENPISESSVPGTEGNGIEDIAGGAAG